MMNSLMNNKVERYKKLLEQLVNDRSSFNSQWEEVSEVIRPAAASFTSAFNMAGKRQQAELFDASGVHANELLASGFYSLLTNPSTQWFDLRTSDTNINMVREVQIWLKEVSRIMYFEIQRPQSGFATALHELYLDYGAYGNGVLFVTENTNMDGITFMSLPMQECYFTENNSGHVVTLYRRFERTVAQLTERYGVDRVHEAVRKAYEDDRHSEKVQVLHVIEPNGMSGKTTKNVDKPYYSAYIDLTNTHFMSESGFDEMPFMAARFYKSSYETYGRGPGSSSLADLKMLQQIVKTTLRGAQKMVDPPLMMPDNGFMSPVRTTPGGITYYRSGLAENDMIKPLLTQGQPRLGEELAQGIRNRVREMFYVDQLQLNEGPQMTATEVLQRTEEKMRLMGPVVGRAQTELLGPCLERVFGILSRALRLPEAPQVLLDYGAKLKIVYLSPFAKAQDQTEANGLLRVQQLVMPFVSTDPSIMDVFNGEEIARGVGDMFALNPKFFRSDKEVQVIREGRANQQAQAEQLSMMKDGGIGFSAIADGVQTLGKM